MNPTQETPIQKDLFVVLQDHPAPWKVGPYGYVLDRYDDVVLLFARNDLAVRALVNLVNNIANPQQASESA